MELAPKLLEKDYLDEAYYKINISIDNSNNAVLEAMNAANTSELAKALVEALQKELNQMTIAGDSSVEAAAARVRTLNNKTSTFTTLKDRLNDGDKERIRKQNEIRRRSNKNIVKIDLTSYAQHGFAWTDAPINVFTDGVSFYTDFDPISFMPASNRTVYVNSRTGSTSNDGLSESSPKSTLNSAMANANSTDTIKIVDDADVIYRNGLWESQVIRKSLRIIGKSGRRRKLVNADKLTYTKVSGYSFVYQATRSNVVEVVDFTFDELGVRYKNATSIAECDAIKGSWYLSGSNLYVHAFNDKVPTEDKVFALLTTPMFSVISDTQDVDLYLENIDIVGGQTTGNIYLDRRGYKLNLYQKDVRYLHTTGIDGNADSINADGVDLVYSLRVICAHSNKDGFNYTAYNGASEKKTAGKFIEVDCEGLVCGVGNKIPNVNNSHNASTAHEGVIGIRINGTYHDTVGVPVCDVQNGTQSLNLACTSYDSLAGTKDVYDACFSTQQSGALMILDGCIAFGAEYDMYAVTGSTMVILNSEFNNKQGGGTYKITNAM
ncbi:hypothetical protein [Niallia taxi]|uniref:hypothetical protein n=1 Tax=Niallia taxi TaxID=2499688 RepID=UPI0015F6DE09|nr:hypothetical protein [Niallia taxi]